MAPTDTSQTEAFESDFQKGPAERRIPLLRETCQVGYDRLRSILERLGDERLIAPFRKVPTVDEALTFRPDLVPTLMALGWELRREKLFRDLFRHAETGEVVATQDDPIAPCGQTFAEIMRAHLYASARRYLERLEVEWASRRAREAEAAWRESQTEDGPLKRLLNRLKGKSQDVGTFTAAHFRPHYSGHGLYEVLKPHLNAEWQFGLVPFYARLRPRHIEALGSAVSALRTPLQIESLSTLTPEDLSVVRGLTIIYAEITLGLAPGTAGLLTARTPEDVARERAVRARIESCQKEAFIHLLTDRIDCVEPLLVSGPAAETILLRLVPIFGSDVWPLFRDPKTLTRIINCPEDLLPLFRTSARAMPAEVSQALAQIKDRTLATDFVTLLLEAVPEHQREAALSEPDRRHFWTQLPARFNNDYTYQPDAPTEVLSVKNRNHLRTVTEALSRSLINGEAAPFHDQF